MKLIRRSSRSGPKFHLPAATRPHQSVKGGALLIGVFRASSQAVARFKRFRAGASLFA